ncbi:MAG: leucine-rich repeat domain-containing protein [Bacilli bacterium]|nr:leucine-rich repeat domain-containing protein [Bacilli bacterium]MCH4235759.1 leucine-rich repeat domain-containing protein [Bacilli bacterium]
MRHSFIKYGSLLLCLMASGCASNCNLQSSQSIDREMYFSYTDKSYSVIGYSGAETNLTIPSAYDDGYHGSYPVTSIGNYAFQNNQQLETIAFPETLVTIGELAFSNCFSLMTVNISANVTTINRLAFVYCPKLVSFSVAPSNHFYSAMDGVLFNYDKTILINYPETKEGAYVVPASVTKIEESAFYYATKLSSITLPSNLEVIGDNAFGSCLKLTSIIIPLNVTNVDSWAFFDCESLSEIYCEAESLNKNWNSDWNPSNRNVCWYSDVANTDGNHWHYVDSQPAIW